MEGSRDKDRSPGDKHEVQALSDAGILKNRSEALPEKCRTPAGAGAIGS